MEARVFPADVTGALKRLSTSDGRTFHGKGAYMAFYERHRADRDASNANIWIVEDLFLASGVL